MVGATKIFQSKLKGLLVFCISWYWSFNWFGKLVRKVFNGVIPVTEAVGCRDNVSSKEEVESKELSIGSFTRFGLPWVNLYYIQCGSRSEEVGDWTCFP